MSAYSLAKKHGKKTYLGKVCDKHPELNGKRYTRNSECTGCRGDAVKRRNAELRRKAAAYDEGKELLQSMNARIAELEQALAEGRNWS